MYDNFVLVLLMIAISPFVSNAQIDFLIRLGEELYNTQDYNGALKAYEQCVIAAPESTICYERAGAAAKQLGETPKAKRLFIQLETLEKENTIALIQLASLYDQEENIPKAIKYYNKLVEIYPENGVYFRKLGQLYSEAKLKKEAFENFAVANKLNPRDLLALRGLVEFHISEKQYISGDSLLSEGLRMDSLNIRLNILMANSKFRQKEYEATALYMDKIRGKYVLKPYHQKMLGYAYIQIDSFDKAIYHLNQALVNDGTKEYAHYNLAVAYEAKEDNETAKYHFEEAVKAGISENIDMYHRNLARLHNEEDNLKAAIPHYQDAYKYSKDPMVLFFLARASDKYYKDKNIAIRYYKKFVDSGYDHPEYIDYSKERKRYLKEQIHLRK